MGKPGIVGEKGRQEATETGIKRNSKEKAQQETTAAVATNISKTRKGVCLVKAGLQQFSTAQGPLQTVMGTRSSGRGVLWKGWATDTHTQLCLPSKIP